MPFENEHSCRLQDPGKFDRFRRQNGAREYKGKPYDVIYGHNPSTDEMEEQAYRYPKDTWSAGEARSHCSSHNGSFEEASGEESSAMPHRIPRIVNAVSDSPWAIVPSKLAAIMELISLRAEGVQLSPDEIKAQTTPRRAVAGPQSVAVLPLFGVLQQRMNIMSEFSGGTSLERFRSSFRDALNKPEVSSIVIDVDSPGGGVYGVPELADEIFEARGEKRIVAVSNSLMASAAYWIGTAADEIVVTPSGETGSIGVLAAHVDQSGLDEKMGVQVTMISAGKYKTEGHPHAPLDEDAFKAIQGRVDEYYEMFVDSVARNRGAKVKDVREGFGEGRVLGAKGSVKAGMADRIGTLDQTLTRLFKSGRRRNRLAALS